MSDSILFNPMLSPFTRSLVLSLFSVGLMITPSTAWADDPIKVQGEYIKSGRGIQVAALAEEKYRVTTYQGGLPGEGWDKGPVQVLEVDDDELEDLLDGAMSVDRISPTLGSKPPSSAIVLFDGTQASIDEHWANGTKLFEDNLLLAGCTTKKSFRDYRLHLEFRTPFVPQALGQGRGNSGVYHQGRYETQVLDSFGFDNEGNTCGAIYGVKPADFNACLPPMRWQTYDVEFIAARWDAQGKKISDAQLTVWLNGYPIHRDQKVPGSTTAAPVGENPSDGPLYLQDHGNPVTYRNIWLVPFDAEQVAKRPRVAGYERIAATGSSFADRELGGRILISELGCTSCHAPGKFAQVFEQNSAPVLEQIGSRVRSGYIGSMLLDVHSSKIGTTMPDLLHGLSQPQKLQAAQRLGAYLESTGKSRKHTRSDAQAAQRGKQLYEKVGCTICHANADGTRLTATSVPLPNLSKKYSFDGLALFLKQPHDARPAGRMPGMHLDDNEARDLAHYLLKEIDPSDAQPNTKYAVYEGGWNKLPDFETLKPIAVGTCEGFDLSVAGRTNNFAVRFESYVVLDQAAKVRFHLGSDDGSRLLVDDKVIVDVDGIHPHQTKSAETELSAGPHRLVVEYFQGGGEWTVDLQWESSQLVKQPIDGWLQLEANQTRKASSEEQTDPPWISEGKVLFQSLGCVQCHAMKETDKAESKLSKAPAIDMLNTSAGCLANEIPAGLPDYRLTSLQKEAIVVALGIDPAKEFSHEDHSKYTLAKLNCIACHERNSWGGPESDKLDLFTSTIPEMGDEGRLPPRLTGVGDKLTDAYLDRVLAEGARHRPYMQVRMPRYGSATIGLAEHWKQTDRPAQDHVAQGPDEAEIRTLASGRMLAGNKGLSCAQCHTFGNQRAIGIQAINMLTMTERLRPEWFRRYMLEPTKYRPGTRMPASFPEGVSVLKTVYEGNADHQIAALWKYLSQGTQAAIPEGLQRDQIALEPQDRPILYRNFLEGLSARGIAVGYPGGLNIAWDAQTMNMAKLWQGQFIDASMHWRDRGVGRQKPLGDLVLNYENRPAVAWLKDPSDAWPDTKQVSETYKFLGYRTDKSGHPTFRYKLGETIIGDRAELSIGPKDSPGLKRTLRIQAGKDDRAGGLWVRLAEGSKITADGKNTWNVDDKYQVTLPESIATTAQVRESAGKKELIVPIDKLPSQASGSMELEYYLRW
ncbi:MAG: family 16 glycoside hydrolase [Planctomycetota bacterium]